MNKCALSDQEDLLAQNDSPGENPVALHCGLNRRHFLQVLAGAAGVALVGGCGGGETKIDEPIKAEAAGAEFKIPGAGNLKAGQAHSFLWPDQTPGLVFKSKDGEFRALSAKCTHAGCTVIWQNGAELSCPCHGSRFDLKGQVLQGPATAPLALHRAREAGEDVFIKKG